MNLCLFYVYDYNKSLQNEEQLLFYETKRVNPFHAYSPISRNQIKPND